MLGRLWRDYGRIALDRFLGIFLPRDYAAGMLLASPYQPVRGTCAALVPAHNEEAVIEGTLQAILAAFAPKDVFVFADGCTDATVEIARSYLPAANVLDHRTNIGKSRGIQTMLATFVFPRRYEFVTFIDADTIVEPTFLEHCIRVMEEPDVAAAVAQVKTASYPKTVYAVYRVFLYWAWQNVVKRVQSFLHASTIASGCATTWRTNVLRQLEFDHKLSTEDFGITFQVHRRRLGKIKYVSSAIVWSQDPFTFKAFAKQGYRWSRAWWEAVRKYKVGLKWFRTSERGIPVGFNAVDIFTAVLIFGTYGFWFRLLSLPILLIHPIDVNLEFFFPSTRESILVWMAFQYSILAIPFIVVGLISHHYRLITYLPIVILLAAVDFLISVKALVSVMRRLYRPGAGEFASSVWVSPERRPMSPADFSIEAAAQRRA